MKETVDGHLFNDRRHSARKMEKGVEVGLGEEFTKGFENPFSSPHPREPIMDQSYPQRGMLSGRIRRTC